MRWHSKKTYSIYVKLVLGFWLVLHESVFRVPRRFYLDRPLVVERARQGILEVAQIGHVAQATAVVDESRTEIESINILR